MNAPESKDITFVIQGPVVPGVTCRSIESIRLLFPLSSIVLSTWEGSCTEQYDADCVVLNKDPGPTVFVFSKKNEAIPININRQIVSTIGGLSKVNTKYAVKLRADNVLYKTSMIELFMQFPHRETQYAFLNKRVVCANYFAKEYERGLRVPYFFSDFFQFGETKDLIAIWDQKRYEDYSFQDQLKGKKQHSYYPNDSVNVEQKLWSYFINKHFPAKLTDEHGSRRDRFNSHKAMINNIVFVDGETLGLEVPERLEQFDSPSAGIYTFKRWLWLYEREFSLKPSVSTWYKLIWTTFRIIDFLKKGLRLKLRKLVYRLWS